MDKKVLLETKNVKKYYPLSSSLFGSSKGKVKAVDGVDLEVYRGEVLGIVGESGCGKSTLGKLLCRLIDVTEGSIFMDGKDLTAMGAKELRETRKKIQMVFQDPYDSLNPRMTIRDIVAEPFIVHNIAGSRDEITQKVIDLLRLVGLDSHHAARYPHQFSGGQRQRVGIARALAVYPKVIIADEPVSALDVSIQSQVINLFQDLKEKLELTYVFISHDLSVVEHISDRVGVMYLGNMVEIAEKNELFRDPKHPYTQALLSAIPVPDPHKRRERVLLEGSAPSAANPPSGCKFHTRCPKKMDICSEIAPEKTCISNTHNVFCHLYSIESENL